MAGAVWYAAYKVSRPSAVHLPPFLGTVGELAVYGTRHADHAASGYTWSRGDLMLKVRLIVAERLWLRLADVRPGSKWVDF